MTIGFLEFSEASQQLANEKTVCYAHIKASRYVGNIDLKPRQCFCYVASVALAGCPFRND